MHNDYIKMDDLENRSVYELRSRNLKLGVWDEERKGFIGIRTKFGARFLFTEYHWDCESFATAQPLNKITRIPEDVPLLETLPTICNNCKVQVKFEKHLDSSGWVHLDDTTTCDNIDPVRPRNEKLFSFLEKLENNG